MFGDAIAFQCERGQSSQAVHHSTELHAQTRLCTPEVYILGHRYCIHPHRAHAFIAEIALTQVQHPHRC